VRDRIRSLTGELQNRTVMPAHGKLGRILRWIAAGVLALPYSDGGPATARLVDCGACGARMVNPMDWHEHDRAHWWVRLRCGACGVSREVVVSDADVKQLERDLEPGLRRIAATVDRLDHERMLREVEAFTAALDRDLIGPDDFARRGHASARRGEAPGESRAR
jgi:hypothetical protein